MKPRNPNEDGRRIGLICPTYNAGNMWREWISAVKSQSEKIKVLVIDSGSSDKTVELANESGFDVLSIPNHKFNHGATRNLGANYFGNSVEILIYLTQDAILASKDSVLAIVKALNNSNIGAVCGRQLPRINATSIEAHARIFNYSSSSSVKSKADSDAIGIKVAFMSNSFAAYSKEVFDCCGKFPEDTIFGEDMYLAARMILDGWKVAYSADACVYHSHSYTIQEEFRRYFDVGVFQKRESWIQFEFGSVGNEGFRYIKSELKYLIRTGKFYLIPESFLRTIIKITAYKLGRLEKIIPQTMKMKLSMNKGYWK
ncbi:glycosyltransferase [Reichenbachiella sp. MALMAid0571]|uniref:glycosyltransferase n=1 Tax=Reichenbachiella sp. MALMAid0571 TaxID=3143939 RepID=UPI0032DF725C